MIKEKADGGELKRSAEESSGLRPEEVAQGMQTVEAGRGHRKKE